MTGVNPTIPLIKADGVKKYFTVKNSVFMEQRRYLKAVDGIDLRIHVGETLGLVGESGCGKSTLGRTILKLHSVTDGDLWFGDKHYSHYNAHSMRDLRKQMQMIFQDPYAALNPRMTIFESVKAPLDVFGLYDKAERRERVESLLQYVGLGREHIHRLPHEMSGGQRQRVVIARAMILNPSFIVCDEPVSALDVSVRAQVLNLMKRVQQENDLAYLFISHDLSVVRYLCNRIAVMYLGKIVEIAPKEELFDHPVHPYTKALLSAIPVPDVDARRERIVLSGDMPSPLHPPAGCRFHTRCAFALNSCAEREPVLTRLSDGHSVACHLAKTFG